MLKALLKKTTLSIYYIIMQTEQIGNKYVLNNCNIPKKKSSNVNKTGIYFQFHPLSRLLQIVKVEIK